MVIDLYCGLGGWAEGFLSEGYSVIGFDIERHDYGTGGYPGQLVLQDVTTLHGSQFKDAAVIVASPPCTEYSYMAMPWSRSKQIARALREVEAVLAAVKKLHGQNCADELAVILREYNQFPEGYTGSRTIEELNRLFMACFRIQREASEAAGRDIPMVVENVRGAQPWVSSANANFGSYYLWGDVGMVGKRVVAGVPRFGVSVSPMKAAKVPGFRFDGVSHGSFQSASVKATKHSPACVLNCNAPSRYTCDCGAEAQKRNPDGTDHGSGSWFGIADSKNRGARSEGHKTIGLNWSNRELRGQDFTRVAGKQAGVTAAQRYRHQGVEEEGVKQRTGGKHGWFGPYQQNQGSRNFSSKSDSRKAASDQIAKIPFPLARYIAQVFKPQAEAVSA